MIKVQNLSYSYTKKPFIENMNFSVEKGEIFGFLGPSGDFPPKPSRALRGTVFLRGWKGADFPTAGDENSGGLFLIS